SWAMEEAAAGSPALQNTATVTVIGPAISVTKTADMDTANIGDTITYTYTVENTGDATLYHVNVSDDLLGAVTLNDTTLEPGEWATGTLTYTVVEADLPGPITNLATANGTDPLGTNHEDTDTESVSLEYNADIMVTKTASPTTIQSGETVTWAINVTNTGGVNLSAVYVNDSDPAAPDYGPFLLNVSQSRQFSYTTSPTADVTNVVDVEGRDPPGNLVTNSSSASVDVVSPDISVTKTASPTAVFSGNMVTWSIVVENTGDVALHDVSVVDSLEGVLASGVSLNPGETRNYQYTTYPTGDQVNTVNVNGTDPRGNEVSDSDSASVSVVAPAVSVTKSDSADPVTEGDMLNYTMVVRNTGDVDLTNVVVVDDYDETMLIINDAHGGVDDGDTITWTIGSLSRGQKVTLKISTTVRITNLAERTLIWNYVDVSSDEGATDSDAEPTRVDPIPELADPMFVIEKTDNVDPVEPTFLLKYTITFMNIGTGTATGVIINDTLPDEVTYVSSVVFPVDNPIPALSVTPTVDGRHVTWALGDLPEGVAYTLLVRVRVDYGLETGTILNNTVTISSSEGANATAWETTGITNMPPVTVKKFHGYVYNETLYEDGEYLLHHITNGTLITLVATDYPIPGASDIARTYYRIFKWDDGRWNMLFNWREYGVWNNEYPYNPIDLPALARVYGMEPEGKYQIEFYSVDRAGNVEGMQWNDIMVSMEEVGL
ncbi:MAG: hypothetical protein R6U10_02805, partial [Thermoplasmatota archaeon]